MDVDGAIQHIEDSAGELEGQLYNFEKVALQRYEVDKKILETMRSDIIKLKAMKTKIDGKQEVSAEEIAAAVPEAFR